MRDKVKSQFISDKRLNSYESFTEYKQNIYQSEEYYILLSIFEISLRNSIDNYSKIRISDNWLESTQLHVDARQRIADAKKKLSQRKEIISHDKIIAELPFGFWTSLFRKSYSSLFRINNIKTIFPSIPNKNIRLINRQILDRELNKIRKFRNRIFHYERITNKSEYNNMKDEILEFLNYFDKEIYEFAIELINRPI